MHNFNYHFLHKLSVDIYSSLFLNDIIKYAFDHLMAIVEMPCIEMHLTDNEGHTLMLKAQRGLSPEFIGTGTWQRGEGLPYKVYQTTEVLFIEDLSREKQNKSQFAQEQLSSYIGFPLKSGIRVLGVIGLYDRDKREFDENKISLLKEAGVLIGQAVWHSKRLEESSLRTKRYMAISRAISVTRQLGTIKQVLADITKVVVQTLGFDKSWLGLVNESENSLVGSAGFGQGMKMGDKQITYSLLEESNNPAVQSIKEQKGVMIPFVQDLPKSKIRTWLDKQIIQSVCFVPIMSGGKPLGTLGAFNQSHQEIQEEDIKALTSVAEQAAIAIENTQLYEQATASEERYRQLFESTGTSLIICDEAFKIRLVNHAFETLSGYERDQLIGKKDFLSFLKDENNSREALFQKLKNSFENLETKFICKQGQEKHVHVISSELQGDSGLLISIIDMTRERELERKLYRSEELASIGELSAGIAHEIRNPLVSMLTSVGLLKEELEISQEGRQLLDVIKEESDHLAAIVEDFLQFARPKKPNLEKEDIHQLIRDAIKRCKDWNNKEVDWQERYDPKLITVILDRYQFQQVITNLIMNGLDAMEQGGCFTVKTEQKIIDNVPYAAIRVSDTGIGIDKEKLDKIFQPFYSTKEKGTGMGLAICRRIIEGHDGDITVSSEKGKGTTFHVFLPIDSKVQILMDQGE